MIINTATMEFQFHSGLIKSEPQVIKAINEFEFQFHSGLIKSLYRPLM